MHLILSEVYYLVSLIAHYCSVSPSCNLPFGNPYFPVLLSCTNRYTVSSSNFDTTIAPQSSIYPLNSID